ncbi:hypothetical protein [Anaeropeptidivorans aminofermentans]|uniref:hypothetical protein n=1 Tax=Anaeropeptidivorans aminofermentans TaxID=2934315 RepID=UPI002025047E|nr:hypothetical protein [Anaeropeptidivorans aminofermentans]
MDYQKAYLILFNGITDALTELYSGNIGYAENILKDLQTRTEEMYIETENN